MRNRVEQSPSSAGIKKGDQVRVMTGRDRGKTGRVLAVNPAKRTVMVEHANMIKRHTRANPSKNVKGGVLEKEGSMSISNILLLCPACNKGTRLGHKVLPDGTKERICRRCGNTLEK
ncbi:MAG: 50S ribosomal protein L24 [Acidobacteriia bacterium]|nr:50S ribosomal protein L24 [Terriglobia bacterium]